MKKIITYLFLLMSFYGRAQQAINWEQVFTFDNSNYQPYFLFDTASQNLWQVGIPQKTVFTASQSPANALLTHLTNTYTINNTSIFQLKSVIPFSPNFGHFLNFSYKMDSEYGVDGGIVEISHDNGTSWINIISDPAIQMLSGWYTLNDVVSSFNQPAFSGTTNGWRYVNSLIGFSSTPDTVLFRFTFKSDGTNTNQDGWMIDDLEFGPYIESVPEYSNNNLISVFPNPVINELCFKSDKKFSRAFDISVYNGIGQKIKEENNTSGNIDVSELKPGIYFMNFKNDNFYASKKITIQR